MLNVEQEVHDKVVILKVGGQLDALTAPGMKPDIDSIMASGVLFVAFDLSSLELIDSSGIGLVVSVYKRLRALKGNLCFVGLNGQPFEVYKLLELHRAIKNHGTIDEALKYLKPK